MKNSKLVSINKRNTIEPHRNHFLINGQNACISYNIDYFPHGMGNNGSDFTVDAVLLKRGMGNFFKGQIGGLAVFNRALDENELRELAELGLITCWLDDLCKEWLMNFPWSIPIEFK